MKKRIGLLILALVCIMTFGSTVFAYNPSASDNDATESRIIIEPDNSMEDMPTIEPEDPDDEDDEDEEPDPDDPEVKYPFSLGFYDFGCNKVSECFIIDYDMNTDLYVFKNKWYINGNIVPSKTTRPTKAELKEEFKSQKTLWKALRYIYELS